LFALDLEKIPGSAEWRCMKARVDLPYRIPVSRTASRENLMVADEETGQAPSRDRAEPNHSPRVNKTEATLRLIAEWTEAGKPTRSNVDLVEELNRRYPGAGFTTPIVAQAKQRLKTHEGAAGRRTEAAPAPIESVGLPPVAPANASEEETAFVRQLRDLVLLLGKDAIKKLIDSL
jgi:hypothetical protein